MSLLEMAQWPEVEWQNQKVASKEVSKGLSASALSALDKAVKLEPGPVPRNEEWENILGHEKVKHGGPPSPRPGHKIADAMGSKKPARTNGFVNGAGQEQGDGIRARRSGKRRRYDDESFEGYGEGFVDDDREDAGGYSSDERASKKKRRKVRCDLSSRSAPTDLSPGVQRPQCPWHGRLRDGSAQAVGRQWHWCFRSAMTLALLLPRSARRPLA